MLNSLLERQRLRNSVINFFNTTKPNQEIFAFHPKIENYVISSKGRIKSLKRFRILKTHKNKYGYHIANVVFSNGKKKTIGVHRLVAETFFDFSGNSKYEVNHINGDKSDNSIYNLEWMTRQENLKHAKDSGLYKSFYGDNNKHTKFTSNIVQDMLELKQLGFTLKEISSAYGTSISYLSTLINKKHKENYENCKNQ